MNNKKLSYRFSVIIDVDNRGVTLKHNNLFVPLDNLFAKDKKRVSNKKAYNIIKQWAKRNNFDVAS